MLHVVDDVRTKIIQNKKSIYIPELKKIAWPQYEVKSGTRFDTICACARAYYSDIMLGLAENES